MLSSVLVRLVHAKVFADFKFIKYSERFARLLFMSW